MQLEEYFDVLDVDDIRIKGTRVGIETVLYDYLHVGLSPEEIALRYPTLALESVYATITYYLHNRRHLDQYMHEWRATGERMRAEQDRHPSRVVQRLRALQQASDQVAPAER
jgi:uncharacterized protein (DUF433 family)